MISGRIAGAAAAFKSGYLDGERFDNIVLAHRKSLGMLHEGMFAPKNKGKPLDKTDEGCAVSAHLLKTGYLDEAEVSAYPGVPEHDKRKAGACPVIECTQNIPCNPCQTVCPKGCISVGASITNLPTIDSSVKCSDCGMCVATCPGQAIFLVDESAGDGYATVALPYEFLPLPDAGQTVTALERNGAELGAAEVISVKTAKAMDRTSVVRIRIPQSWAMKARFLQAHRLERRDEIGDKAKQGPPAGALYRRVGRLAYYLPLRGDYQGRDSPGCLRRNAHTQRGQTIFAVRDGPLPGAKLRPPGASRHCCGAGRRPGGAGTAHAAVAGTAGADGSLRKGCVVSHDERGLYHCGRRRYRLRHRL